MAYTQLWRNPIMPVLHVIVLLAILHIAAFFGGIALLWLAISFGLCLLLIIALYRRP
jgi:hypothetical protein